MIIKGPINTVTQSGSHLMADQSGAVYQWVNCNGMIPIAGATGQTFTPDSNGQYAVFLIKDGCVDSSGCINVTNVGVTAPGSTSTKMSVYPNPASGQITVKAWIGLAGGQVLLRDMAGKVIRQEEIKSNMLTIDVSTLSTGMYIVELNDGRERYMERVSVVR